MVVDVEAVDDVGADVALLVGELVAVVGTAEVGAAEVGVGVVLVGDDDSSSEHAPSASTATSASAIVARAGGRRRIRATVASPRHLAGPLVSVVVRSASWSGHSHSMVPGGFEVMS
jgi:hypothetical protein